MRRREAKGAPSADLLVCFPSRAHLTLMPKSICSPARPSEPKRHQNNNHHHHHHPHHHLKKVSNRGGGAGGQASPQLWAKTKPMSSEISEPTSPKVTCAGQIKVRPKPTSCKNWQSVMEEIEKLHNNKKNKKRHNWVDSLGIKKDIMQFLTCLRTIKFDFRCFGSFPTSDVTSDDEEDDHEDQDNQQHMEDGNETSRTVFSKWFMVLQEDQNNNGFKKEVMKETLDAPCAPPPNALLLMRCRSAPAKSWLEEREEEEEEEEEDEREEGDDDDEDEDHEENKVNLVVEEEKRKKEERLVVMRYDNDFYKISSHDIAKETWVVGGIRDPLSRSRSWKR